MQQSQAKTSDDIDSDMKTRRKTTKMAESEIEGSNKQHSVAEINVQI